jgi:predicted transcriptional regulator
MQRVIGQVLLPKRLVCDEDLTASDIRLFVALLALRKPDGTVDAGLDALAGEVGVTKFTIVDSIKRLVEKGFVKKQLRGCYTALLTIKSETTHA